MFIQDTHNNTGRFCSVDATSGRTWRVQVAVAGSRYLVRNVQTGEHRVVAHRAMSNLY